LFTNPLGLAVSGFVLVAAGDLAATHALHQRWHFALTTPLAIDLCWFNIVVQALRVLIRMACVYRIFGFGFSLGVPVRAFYESLINGYATMNAWHTYVSDRLAGRPLVWLKTEHTYPSRATLSVSRKTLEEVLVGSGYLAEETLSIAKRTLPAGFDLGTHLLENGWISEEVLWEALSLATGVDTPFQQINPEDVSGRVGRFVPRRIQRNGKLLPVGVRKGSLLVATAAPLTDESREQLERCTQLRIEIQLVTPGNFASLSRHFNQWQAPPAQRIGPLRSHSAGGGKGATKSTAASAG
jgi:bacteriophage N4 adsorption protein B